MINKLTLTTFQVFCTIFLIFLRARGGDVFSQFSAMKNGVKKNKKKAFKN
jgi:hypothetical protein